MAAERWGYTLMPMTRYVVVGAGAVGGTIGARLAHAGQDVVLVARGEHLRAIHAKGFRLRTPHLDTTVRIPAVGSPQTFELTEEDVLVLATKTHQAQEALALWADAKVISDGVAIGTAGHLLPILTALNGVASETIALRYFQRVYGVCVRMPAAHLNPGEVIARGTPSSGLLHIGRVPAMQTTERDLQLLAGITEDWTKSGVTVQIADDVMPWKYRKLISNIGNVFQALLGSRELGGPLIDAAREEARSVLDSAGITYTDDATEEALRAESFSVAEVPGAPAELGGSSWQSLARGTGSIETDYLNGEIVLIARQQGLNAPINATMTSLARKAARSGARPGDITPDELAAALGLG